METNNYPTLMAYIENKRTAKVFNQCIKDGKPGAQEELVALYKAEGWERGKEYKLQADGVEGVKVRLYDTTTQEIKSDTTKINGFIYSLSNKKGEKELTFGALLKRREKILARLDAINRGIESARQFAIANNDACIETTTTTNFSVTIPEE